jgi:hypothetical protein
MSGKFIVPADAEQRFERLAAYLAEVDALVEGALGHELSRWRYEGSASVPIVAATCQQCAAVVRVDAHYRVILEEDSVAARVRCLYAAIARANVAARNERDPKDDGHHPS